MEKNDDKSKEVSLQLLQNNHKNVKIYKDTTSQIIDSTPPLWFSKRLLVATVFFFCFVNFQILRNNINITVVEMTFNRSYTEGNHTVVKPAEYDWDTTTVGLIISILAYGGLFSLFGDLAISRFGGMVTSAGCMLLGGIFTMLHPAILAIDFNLFLACRFLTGVFEMFFYVSTSDVFSKWFPKKERSMLISFSFNGTNVGVAGVYPLCGYLAYRWGWRSVFYVTGFISIVSAILCLILVKNQPSQDKWISKKELSYIMEETDCDHNTQNTKVSHPYKSILTSVPVWTLCVGLFVFMWVASILNACLPLYIKDLTNKETDEIGIISSIPNIVYFFLFPIDGILMDYWKNNTKTTETTIHKILLGTAFIFASLMLAASAIACNLTATMIFFVLIQIPMSFAPIIVQVMAVNLAPDHASVVCGMTSFSFSLSAILVQTVTGFMTKNHSLQEWNNCFYLASAISAFGAVMFVLFGSSEVQPWGVSSSAKEERRLSPTN